MSDAFPEAPAMGSFQRVFANTQCQPGFSSSSSCDSSLSSSSSSSSSSKIINISTIQLWHVCNLLCIRHLQLSICRLRRCIGAGGTALMWVQRCRCIIFAGSYKSTTLNTEGEKNAGAQMQVEPSTHLELYA